MNRMYCTLREVIDDLEQNGVRNEAVLMGHIRSASEWIDRNIGQFIPVTAARTFHGLGLRVLFVDPILSVTTLTDRSTAVLAANYHLRPINKHWEDGPYTWIEIDPFGSQSGFTAGGDIVVTGLWGLYNFTKTTGATLATALTDTTGTTVVVSDGSLVQPGMVVLLDTEQMMVEAGGAFTDSTATLGAAITDTSGETVTVSDGTKVKIGELIKIDLEWMRVKDINTNTVSVIRGWNDTVRATHLISTKVYVQRTYTVVRGVNGTTAATHLINAPISRYCPPEDINYLCRQMASLMWKKAQGGYAGKTGSAETGEVFYNNEFPSSVIKPIKRRYQVSSGGV